MILLPITGFFETKRPPVVSVTIIALCALVLFLFYDRDDRIENEAYSYYLDSGLGKIESERFSAYLKTKGILEEHKSKATKDEIIWDNYDDAFNDYKYQKDLRANLIIQPGDPDFESWREKRSHFEKKLNRSVHHRYSFISAENDPVTWLTHIFLHVDFQHFFGNMLYFLPVAFVLETGVGGPIFALIYLAGGVGALLMKIYVIPPSFLYSLGASGAISGIMATLVVLYGLRRIRFFYSVGFYFGYISFPALIILPIWIAKELVYWSFKLGHTDGGTAYWAHIGGFVAGGALGFLIRAMGWYRKEIFKEKEPDLTPLLLEKGLKRMAELDFEKAREAFREVLRLKPGHIPAIKHLFSIEKRYPGRPEFNQTAENLFFALAEADPRDPSLSFYFREYQTLAEEIRLSPKLLCSLAFWFVDSGEVETAESLVQDLAEDKGDPRVPALILRLAGAMDKALKDQKAKQWRKRLVKNHPDSLEARMVLAGSKTA